MKATLEGYTFDFPSATSIRKFDDARGHLMSHAMKAVDVVIELPQWRLFIEVKNFEKHRERKALQISNKRDQRLEELRADLVYKYRDSFLYFWCQEAPEKKNAFIFLIDLVDAPSIHAFQETLKDRFPVAKSRSVWSRVWERTFVDYFFVVNKALWNKSYLSDFGTIDEEREGE